MAATAPSAPSPPAQVAEHLAINIIITPPSTNLPESNIPTQNETAPPSSSAGSGVSPSTSTIREGFTPSRRDSLNRPLPTLNSLAPNIRHLVAEAALRTEYKILSRAVLKLAGVLQEHHVRSLEKILTIITCIEDGWYGDWDQAKRRILFERKEEVREELRDRMEAASA